MSEHKGCDYEAALREPGKVKRIVEIIVPRLKRRRHDFDGFVVSGYSMSLISSILAYKMNMPVAVVKKQNEKRHSGFTAEGLCNKRWLIVDDLICSGDTIRHVQGAIEGISGKVVGVVLYNAGYNDSPHKRNIGVFGETIDAWFSFASYEIRNIKLSRKEVMEIMLEPVVNKRLIRHFWFIRKEYILQLNGVLPDFWQKEIVDSGIEEQFLSEQVDDVET
jgi:hypoxanthine phosphoribosyltransferase